MIRNAVGHGIETPEERVAAGKAPKGTVRLSAFHQENYIVIEIADDGRGGIDPEAVKESAVRKGLISEEAAARMSDRDAVNLIFRRGGFPLARRWMMSPGVAWAWILSERT